MRPRTSGDLDAVTEVAARVHANDGYPFHLPTGDVRGFLERPVPIQAWVAEDDNSRIVGHVALHDSTSRPTMELVESDDPARRPIYVARLLVDPGSRRLGIGQRLLDHARQAALDSDRTPYLDVVNTSAAHPAIELYEKQGWARIGRVRFPLGEDNIEELVFRSPGI